MLWQSSLSNVSFTIAVSVFERIESPNFRLIMLFVVSMLLLL